ncbi:hypothetical protein RJ40_01675 [Methanofollis aquaemaris]|uniref:Uncharacterized protein n=1 Tax=Methanofollis aquaemaris TaxID=126734 RepID=A0A8A3S349_9EURY|nr:hypothetical protein [Methanofollis aquaemaris]QSZ66299.1 hypothetical protein RJ40_01675 [Methanofollis aquaemaris]
MEKEDVISLVAGIAIVIIVAFVVKPMVQGETPGQAIPSAEGQAGVGAVLTPTIPAPPLQTPTPVPTWDGKTKEVGFVDPASYNINLSNDGIGRGVKIPPVIPTKYHMVAYARIQGKGSGTTEIIRIPFPYWELWYDADPYSTDFCFFNVQVMDADDPNRFVRILSHPYTDFKSNDDKKSGWTEQFYEGNGDYWFVINTQMIRSYDLRVMVPEQYAHPENS